jgi:hypothetical protein
LTCGAIVLFVATLVGCANPCTPFRAAWYLDDSLEARAKAVVAAAAASAPSPAASAPTVFLALLNEGSKTLELTRVGLNPIDEGEGSTVLLSLAPHPAQKLELQPGELRLFAVNHSLGQCVLPVSVLVWCSDGRSKPQPVSGLMPNYLHSTWIESCVK